MPVPTIRGPLRALSSADRRLHGMSNTIATRDHKSKESIERGLDMKTMNNRLGGCLVLAMLLSVLLGCGQKGDLYLPDESDSKQDFGTR